MISFIEWHPSATAPTVYISINDTNFSLILNRFLTIEAFLNVTSAYRKADRPKSNTMTMNFKIEILIVYMRTFRWLLSAESNFMVE